MHWTDIKKLLRRCLSVCVVLAGSPLAAQEWRFEAQNTFGMIGESERDLGAGIEEDVQELFLSVKPTIRYRHGPFEGLLEARGFVSTNVVPIDEDQGGGAAERFAELRQLWVRRNELFNVQGASLTVGRIRLRDERRSWLDRDTEAGLFTVQRSRIAGSVGIGRRLRSFRSDKSDFRQRDEDIHMAFGNVELEWMLGHRLGVRLQRENDRSSSGEPEDRIDFDGFWHGIYANGQAPLLGLQYFAEAVRLTGERTLDRPDDEIDTDIDAWSVSGSVDVGLSESMRVGVAYATTSSGGSDTNEKSFFQTAASSNRMRLDRDGVQFHQLGEAYRADTTNMRTVGAYAHIAIRDRHQLSFKLQSHERRNTSERIFASGVRGALIDGESDLGTGVDLAWGWRIPVTRGFLQRPSVSLRASVFVPGDAYPAGSDTKTRFVAEFKARL